MTIAEILRRRTVRRAALAVTAGVAVGVALVGPGRHPGPTPDRGAGGARPAT